MRLHFYVRLQLEKSIVPLCRAFTCRNFGSLIDNVDDQIGVHNYHSQQQKHILLEHDYLLSNELLGAYLCVPVHTRVIAQAPLKALE